MINAPDILFDQLAGIFRSWLLHGTVTLSLLACAFLPLLKSSQKDPADTGSYRAIAGSSLILKLFEKVMLLVWGSSSWDRQPTVWLQGRDFHYSVFLAGSGSCG